MIDLWPPDLGNAADVRAPVTILKEQARLLGEKTRYLVEGVVDTRVTSGSWQNEEPEVLLEHRFKAFAPALNYSRTLFEVRHSPETLYPARVVARDQDISQQAENEDELLDALRDVLHAPWTTQTIQALLVQSV